MKQLGELKTELGQLRIQKIASSGTKLNRMYGSPIPETRDGEAIAVWTRRMGPRANVVLSRILVTISASQLPAS